MLLEGPLVECSACGRFLRHDETTCVFCERGTPLRTKVLRGLGAVITPVVLAACYGPPPGQLEDRDQDGFAELEGDCNDDDPSIHPEADEVCDDEVDNDCDGDIDADDTDCDLQ